MNVEVQRADLETIAAVERAGGRIRTAYYDLESLRVAVDPEKWLVAGVAIGTLCGLSSDGYAS